MFKARILVAVSLSLALVAVPLSARADETRKPHADINITWDGEFNRAHGVRSGRGTAADPYVISGWMIGNIQIRDTTKAVRIRDNTITGTLTMNWIGSRVKVLHNEIGDLRVNQNTARWGDPASGTIMHNTIGTVGQLRHFDGMFMRNTVGTAPSGLSAQSYPDVRAVNFDGFNGSHFAENTIYGYVDARLHGHHHSSTFNLGSHQHSDGPHAAQIDHTKRYHKVLIEDNLIYTSHDYALSYLDTNHAANDRTANSETNPYLNAPHVHYTRAKIVANKLYGAGIRVDVFNAQDERHKGTPSGSLLISRNRITLEREPTDPLKALQGIEIRKARAMSLKILGNRVLGPAPIADVKGLNPILSQGAGITLNGLDRARVLIDGTTIRDRQFGIRALQLTKSVWWTVGSLSTTDVDQAIVYDSTVANPPKRT